MIRKLIALLLLGCSGTSLGTMSCFYPTIAGVRVQQCYDLNNPSDARAYKVRIQKMIDDTTPRAGVLDGPLPVKQMLSAPDLRLPETAPLVAFRVDKVADGQTIEGVMNFVPTQIRLANIQVLPERNAAAIKSLEYFMPPGSVVYLEMTGKYENNRPTAFVWQTSDLLNLILVERGLATPTHALPTYLGELDAASAFSQKVSSTPPATP